METRSRSLAKAVSWRILASLITGALVYGFTRKGTLALGIGLSDSVIKIMVYYYHERLWMRVPYGHDPVRAGSARPAAVFRPGMDGLQQAGD